MAFEDRRTQAHRAQMRRYMDPVVVSRIQHMELRARLIVEGFLTGIHKSPFHGFSVEFAEHRAYNPGESLRTIDWKVYGRTEKLYTKRFEEETNLRAYIVLDVSDSMRYPLSGMNKLVYGANLMGALGYLMVKQRDAVGLCMFDEQLRAYLAPKATTSWLYRIFRELQAVIDDQNLFTHKTATPAVLHTLSQKMHQRSLVVILSDLFADPTHVDALFPALQRLRHARHEVLIFQMLEPDTEAQFNFPNQPLLLKDLETGEQLKVHPEQIRTQYRDLFAKYQNLLRRRCRELGIELVELDVRQPYDKALSDYLRKRSHITRKS